MKTKKLAGMFITIILLSITAFYVASIPSGPVIDYIGNRTTSVSSTGIGRASDEGGYFHIMNLNLSQQNYKWKAYIGNVSGALTLQDSDGYSIYDWSIAGNPSGEVYASRSQNVDWSSTLSCASSGNIEAEDTALNIASSTIDSINQTFSGGTHKALTVAGQTINQNTCKAIHLNIGGVAQTPDVGNEFQEILIQDNSDNVVYVTWLSGGAAGYDNTNYDFQMIVADDETSGVQTGYYFYLEIDG